MVDSHKLVEYPLIGEDRTDLSYAPYQALRASFPSQLLPGIFPTHQPLPTRQTRQELDRGLQDVLEDTNRTLEPFGYRLERAKVSVGKPFDLYQNGKLVQTGIAVKTLLTNPSGTNFALIFTGEQDQHWFLQVHGMQALNQIAAGLPVTILGPVFVGDQLVTACYEGSGGYKQQGDDLVPCDMADPSCLLGQAYSLQADGETIYQEVFMGPLGGYSLRGLWSWSGHWVLETERIILVDGKPAREGLGRLYSWHMLGDQPLYFYHDGDQAGIVYTGDPVPLPYDHVVYEGTCCGNGRYDPLVFEDRVVFFARREGVWYYVELWLE
jgi:hypothetical protein